MQRKTLLDIDLQLFAEGGAAAGAPAGDGSAQATESALPKAETPKTGSSRRSRSGELSNVVYGKQEDAPAEPTGSDAGSYAEGKGRESGVTTTSDTLEAKRKAFEELIDGEYKDIYQEMFQKQFNRRFKETKGMEQALAAQKPIVDLLMQKYKIADGDVAKLQSAIEQDDTYWLEGAQEAGLTVEQYKAMQKLERENEQLRQARQRQAGEEQMQRQLADWTRQGEALKELYPTFDFKTEVSSSDFLGLLRAGIPVQKAYELMHMDEIKAEAAKAAAQTAGAQMEARIKSRASRPSENGTSSQSAAIVKSDVHQLTRQDRANIARQVQMGKTIKF